MNYVKGWRCYYNCGEKVRKGVWWMVDVKQVLM